MHDKILFPLPQDLPGSKVHAPFVLIGDEAFPGEVHLMKPYSCKSKAISAKT